MLATLWQILHVLSSSPLPTASISLLPFLCVPHSVTHLAHHHWSVRRRSLDAFIHPMLVGTHGRLHDCMACSGCGSVLWVLFAFLSFVCCGYPSNGAVKPLCSAKVQGTISMAHPDLYCCRFEKF